MREDLTPVLVASVIVLGSMTMLNAQVPEPARRNAPVAAPDVASSPEPGVAEQGDKPAAGRQSMRRSVSVSSGYFKNLYANALMADIGIEAMQGYSFYSQKLESVLPRNNVVRMAARAGTLFGN